MDKYIKEDTRRKKKNNKNFISVNKNLVVKRPIISNNLIGESIIDEKYDLSQQNNIILNKKDLFGDELVKDLEMNCVKKHTEHKLFKYSGSDELLNTYHQKQSIKKTIYHIPIDKEIKYNEKISKEPTYDLYNEKKIKQFLAKENIEAKLESCIKETNSNKLNISAMLIGNVGKHDCELKHSKNYNLCIYPQNNTRSSIIITINNNNPIITHIGVIAEIPYLQPNHYDYIYCDTAYVTKFKMLVLINKKWIEYGYYTINKDYHKETIIDIGQVSTNKIKIIPINFHLRPEMRVAVYGISQNISQNTDDFIEYAVVESIQNMKKTTKTNLDNKIGGKQGTIFSRNTKLGKKPNTDDVYIST